MILRLSLNQGRSWISSPTPCHVYSTLNIAKWGSLPFVGTYPTIPPYMDRPDHGRIKWIHIILTTSNPLRATANFSLVQQTSSCQSIQRSSDKPNRLSSGHNLNIYATRRSDRYQASQERLCRTIVKTGAFYIGLISPVIFVKEVRCKRSTFRDQLVIPSTCIPMVLHACYDHAMSGGHLAYNTRLTKSTIGFGGRRYIATSKLGARIARPANVGKQRTAGPSYPQVIYPLIAHLNVFQ